MDARIAQNIIMLLQPDAQRALVVGEAMHALEAIAAPPAPAKPSVEAKPDRSTRRAHPPSVEVGPTMFKTAGR